MKFNVTPVTSLHLDPSSSRPIYHGHPQDFSRGGQIRGSGNESPPAESRVELRS